MNLQAVFPIIRTAIGVFLVYLVILLGVFLVVGDGYPTTPPAGWTIQMREFPKKGYRWVRPSGVGSAFPKSSYEEAVDSAWGQFEFARFNRSGHWKGVEGKP